MTPTPYFYLQVAKNNYQALQEEKDVNNLTGALKLFFRELKEPLLPFNTYDAFTRFSSGQQASKYVIIMCGN